ncbi:MAG: tRNA 2-thiouridine(34) synthase MnmA [Clostridia bacterium]|nr:tRNA 2-thiouridine(34) synthase MnmA [Clostridia bacterium]
MNSKKVLIAMSGGVDSSVTAALIKDAGFDCVGATMKLFTNEDAGISHEKTCCSLSDTEDARSVAARLGFDHYVFNFKDGFKRDVISRFICAYESGATPNPCIDCNRFIKFKLLFDRAKILGCDFIATGHYARIEQRDGRYILRKGLDESKDQSYVLYSLSQQALAHTLLPLGGLDKETVRQIADRLGFVNASKPDSQDICFVPDGDYAAFIEQYTHKTYPPGEFTDENGRVLGTHRGMIRYTVGQRRGLGLALPEPMYVKYKDTENNRVVLAPDSGLYSDTLTAHDFNWILFEDPGWEFRGTVKTRYKAKAADATVIPLGGGRVKIVFDTPQRAITRGQAAVVYQGDAVVGGGTIE